VLRQAVLNLNPRHFRANKNVKLGAYTGVIIEQPGWNTHCCEISRLARQGGAANTTKIAEAARGRLKALDQIFTGHQAELVRVDMQVTGDMRAGQLTAVAAVTVGQRPSLVDLKSDRSAKATSLDHWDTPSCASGSCASASYGRLWAFRDQVNLDYPEYQRRAGLWSRAI
jgi:hypothetical protein